MKELSPKDKTVHDQFSGYGKNAKKWMNKCILLLPKIEKNRIWEKKGFSSIFEYAAKIAGMSRNKVNEGLRILKKTENLPAIQKVIEKKGIFAVKPVVNIATEKTDQLWAKRASEMKKSTLETFVRDYRKEQQAIGRPGAWSPTNKSLNKPTLFQENLKSLNEKDLNQDDENTDSRIQISMKLDREIVDKLKKIKEESDWNQVMKKLLKYSQKELEAEHHQIIHLGYINDSEITPEYSNIALRIKRLQRDSIGDAWKQIKNLPIYDMKNVINKRVFEFRRNHSQQFIT